MFLTTLFVAETEVDYHCHIDSWTMWFAPCRLSPTRVHVEGRWLVALGQLDLCFLTALLFLLLRTQAYYIVVNTVDVGVCSVAQSCPTVLCNPMDCSTPSFPVLHCLPELAQTHVHWVSDAVQPSHPLLSLSPPAFNLSFIRVFSNELALCIRWPKYWRFSFGISPSSEYSGMISFRMDWTVHPFWQR